MLVCNKEKNKSRSFFLILQLFDIPFMSFQSEKYLLHMVCILVKAVHTQQLQFLTSKQAAAVEYRLEPHTSLLCM